MIEPNFYQKHLISVINNKYNIDILAENITATFLDEEIKYKDTSEIRTGDIYIIDRSDKIAIHSSLSFHIELNRYEFKVLSADVRLDDQIKEV